jgi:uncharacterized protein
MQVSPTTVSKLQRVFAQEPGIVAVYLFGSHATGRAVAGSDFDLAIVPMPGADLRARKLELLAALAEAGFCNVDLLFLDGHDVVLAHEATRLNCLLYTRPEFDRGAFYSRALREYLDFVPYLRRQRQALKHRWGHAAA